MDREQIARKLFEGMPDALVVADRKGLIRVWNGGAERIFGFAEGEALGQSLDIITPERLRERHWNGYEATMRTGQTKYGAGDLLSVPAIRKDGAQISIQFSIVPLRGRGLRLAGGRGDHARRHRGLRRAQKVAARASWLRESSRLTGTGFGLRDRASLHRNWFTLGKRMLRGLQCPVRRKVFS